MRWRPARDVAVAAPREGGPRRRSAAGPLGAPARSTRVSSRPSILQEKCGSSSLTSRRSPTIVRAASASGRSRDFPAVTRDIAVVVDDAFLAESILEEIRALGDPLVESVALFDCYRGAPIAEGKKSLAYTIAYRAPDRTLTDDEVNAAHERVRDAPERPLRADLRS